MPYNPGVNDISGQIWGNTISNVGNTIANTISAYKAKTDENKSFDAKSKSVENLIKTHASDFGLSKEEMDAMLSRNPDETPKERYERLNGHIDQSVISHQMKQWKAQSEQQENMKAAFSQNRDLNQWMNGQGRGVYSPEVQKQMQAYAQDPYRSSAARLQAATGRAPDAQELITAVDKYQSRPTTPKFEVVKYMDNGKEITVDKQTGQKVAESPAPRTYASPEEQARAATLTAEGTEKAKSAQANLNDISSQAETARSQLADISQIKKLYAAGAQSGFGQEQITGIRSALARLTGDNPESLNSQQALDSSLSKLAFQMRSTLSKGTGQISDYETKGIERAAANIGKTEGANMKVVELLGKAAARIDAMDKKRIEMEDAGASTIEIDKALRKMRASMPILDADESAAVHVDTLLEKYK